MNLFDSTDEQKRQRLRAAGWHEAGGKIMGRFLWRRPDGAVLDEEFAFEEIERTPDGDAREGSI